MKVLLSAYACEPGRGSEPGVGWNLSRELARHHDVCVVTRANNRTAIEEAEKIVGNCGIEWLYYDLPRWASFWKRGQRGVQLYYYLWQWGAGRAAGRRAAAAPFDVVHHITFVKYWTPSFMGTCAPVFVWGPVGGGDDTPEPFMSRYSIGGRIYERLRDIARWLADKDPNLRRTARLATVALVTTEATGKRVTRLGARHVELLWDSGLTSEELSRLPLSTASSDGVLRFLSSGRLIHLKGFDLGIEAFAKAGIPDSEYWVVGGGPDRERLERLSAGLGVRDRVRFFGQVSRDEALELLRSVDVLVHPSLHDSGGWVCTEALAAGKPVICLDTGGPPTQVTAECGFIVPVDNVDSAIDSIALAMRTLARPDERLRMGLAGIDRAKAFSWHRRAQTLTTLYEESAKRRTG